MYMLYKRGELTIIKTTLIIVLVLLNIQPLFHITFCLIYNAQKQFKLLLS